MVPTTVTLKQQQITIDTNHKIGVDKKIKYFSINIYDVQLICVYHNILYTYSILIKL